MADRREGDHHSRRLAIELLQQANLENIMELAPFWKM
jgi:hypothetical protein